VTRFRALLTVVVLLAGLLLAVACGGDDDDTNGGGAGAPTAGATTDGGDAGDDGTDGDGAPSGDTADLLDVAQEFTDASFRGEYKLTAPPGNDLADGTLVIYKSGADRLRFDLTAEQEGETVEVILLETPQASVFCLKNAGEFGLLLGVPEGEGVCFNDDPTAGEGAGDFSDIIEEIESGDWEVVDRSEREIAGEDADCYQTRSPDGQESNVCFSDDAYLLATTEPDGSGLEATSVSGDVDDSDFDTPYEVRELPDIGGGQ
jgi:hypothetical protein